MSSSDSTRHSQVVCIGAGLSGLATAVRLQQVLGFRDIHLYDRNSKPGGVWTVQRYPGVACDIPADFYSFSFSPTPQGWSQFRPSGREFEQYLHDVATSHDLWPLMSFNTTCLEAKWEPDASQWCITLHDTSSEPEAGQFFRHTCQILCIATGNLTVPREVDIPGLSTFKGPVVHTSEWPEGIDLDNKNVVVFGNGASGSQLVPHILPRVSTLLHVFRSPQWYIRPVSIPYGPLTRWILQNVPLTRKMLRFVIFATAELAYRGAYLSGAAARTRKRWERNARAYIVGLAPGRYHEMLVPKYSMGCKRPVFNANYLQSLHAPHLTLAPHSQIQVLPHGISMNLNDGEHFRPADVIILATGYTTNTSDIGFPITGKDGITLEKHWNELGGPAAYATVAVHGFPNLFFVKGPNTGTGHTSTILVIENVLNLILEMMKPLLSGTLQEIEVHKDAERAFVTSVQETSKQRVWLSGCTSWYIRKDGWNGTVYPWSQVYCWWSNLFPRWSDWRVMPSRRRSQ